MKALNPSPSLYPQTRNLLRSRKLAAKSSENPETKNTPVKTRDYQSSFEKKIETELKKLGWEIIPQIGISKQEMDLGVINPEQPNQYLAGIRCEPAKTHSYGRVPTTSKTQEISAAENRPILHLEEFLWNRDKTRELEKLQNLLRRCLHNFRGDVAARKLKKWLDDRDARNQAGTGV
jgi:REase_MTES_1575